jgi:hypothetical protein
MLLHFFASALFSSAFRQGQQNLRLVGAEIKLLPPFSWGSSDKISAIPRLSLILPKITKVAQKCKSIPKEKNEEFGT